MSFRDFHRLSDGQILNWLKICFINYKRCGQYYYEFEALVSDANRRDKNMYFRAMQWAEKDWQAIERGEAYQLGKFIKYYEKPAPKFPKRNGTQPDRLEYLDWIVKRDVESELAKYYKPENIFILKASGDSMEDDGIFHGATLYIHRQPRVTPSDVACCELDGIQIIKHVRYKAGLAILESRNSRKNYPPEQIEEGRPFQIVGKMVQVINKLRY